MHSEVLTEGQKSNFQERKKFFFNVLGSMYLGFVAS
jgi:hypothetical protein